MRSTLSELNFTLTAGQEIPYAFTGGFVRFKETDDTIQLRIEDQGWVTVSMGEEYKCESGELFTSFSLRNPTAATVTGRLVWGRGQYTDNRLNVIPTRGTGSFIRFTEAPASVMEQGRGTLAAGSSGGPLSGAATAVRGRRKFLLITNESPTEELHIVGLAGTLATTQAIVWPKATLRLDCDATFYIKNFSAVSLDWHYSAYFYNHPLA